jgi:hypothetical protein
MFFWCRKLWWNPCNKMSKSPWNSRSSRSNRWTISGRVLAGWLPCCYCSLGLWRFRIESVLMPQYLLCTIVYWQSTGLRMLSLVRTTKSIQKPNYHVLPEGCDMALISCWNASYFWLRSVSSLILSKFEYLVRKREPPVPCEGGRGCVHKTIDLWLVTVRLVEGEEALAAGTKLMETVWKEACRSAHRSLEQPGLTSTSWSLWE